MRFSYTIIDCYPHDIYIAACFYGFELNPLQEDAGLHADLRRFLTVIYRKANLPAATFKEPEIISRCVDAFVANGFNDEKSVVEACEYINSDDLHLKTANIPLKLIAIIYKTILDLREPVSSEVRFK